MDVCLLPAPWVQVDKPALGVAVLAAACRQRDLTVRTIHANVLLAARVGIEAHRQVSVSPHHVWVGGRLFLPHAYPSEVQASLGELRPLPASSQALFDALTDSIEPFLDDLCARIVALRPRILGLSSIFSQVLACSAIALRVKTLAPETRIVIGGPDVASPMGEALAELFPWVDHFFLGEADLAFPDFCEAVVRGEVGARIVNCPPLMDMRQSPAPAFEDYFEDLRAAQATQRLPGDLPHALMAEASRGCWWGAKHHCTFCGLIGSTLTFRAKPAAMVLDELRSLEERWGVRRFMMADNILPLAYFDELIPTLAAQEAPPDLFYEVKANLSEAQLILMEQAGIRSIQPGIESLSSNLLRAMRKGVSAHQNLALLRNARGCDMSVDWNYLYGFPGETVEDYAPVERLIPCIEHLEPPIVFARIVIDRFSPYFNDPVAFGIGRLSPYRAYRGLFPRDVPLADVAYHFQGRYSTAFLEDAQARGRLALAIAVWQLGWAKNPRPELKLIAETADGALVRDTRRIARMREQWISPEALAVLRFFAPGRARETLDPALQPLVDDLLAAHFLVDFEGKLIALVTHASETVSPVHPVEPAATSPQPVA